MPFQPILYFFLWGRRVRITFNGERIPDIPFRQVLAGWAKPCGTSWPLDARHWRSSPGDDHHLRPRIKLCGHWLRLTADFGMVIALLTYHIATAVHYGFKDDEHIFSRYMSASCILFTFALTVRDAWILIVIDRLAAGIRDGRFQ